MSNIGKAFYKKSSKVILPGTVVAVGIVFSLALGWCLLHRPLCAERTSVGDFILSLMWWSHLIKLTKPVEEPPHDHKTNCVHCIILLKQLLIRRVWCNVRLQRRSGESGFASSLLPLAISTIWNRDHVIMRSLLCASFLVDDPDSVTLQINSLFAYYYDLLIYCFTFLFQKATTELKEIVHLQNTK